MTDRKVTQLRQALLNPNAVGKLVADTRDGEDSRVVRELLETAGELHQNGLMSRQELPYIVLLANTRPMTYEQVKEFIARRYPRWGTISLGGIRLRAATPEAARDAMQRDFDAGKREMPDIESDDNKA